MSHRKIIIGYDGSSDADRAVRWALDEAGRTGAPVELCYSYEWPVVVPESGRRPVPGAETDHFVEDMVEEAAADAAATHPAVQVSTVITPGPAAVTLARRSSGAGAVVLGSRGSSRCTGPLGSVACAVSLHAHCPVVVIRGDAPPLTPVLVGVDDSPAAESALEFAFEQAAIRGVPLRAVRAWLPPVTDATGPLGLKLVDDRQWRSLAELVERLRAVYPAVKATHEVVVGHPAHALRDAAAHAQLVVVGTRGEGAFRGRLLGSVSQHLLRHAETSVAVVPER